MKERKFYATESKIIINYDSKKENPWVELISGIFLLLFNPWSLLVWIVIISIIF